MASEPVAQELIVDPALTAYSVLSGRDEAGLDSDRDVGGPDDWPEEILTPRESLLKPLPCHRKPSG